MSTYGYDSRRRQRARRRQAEAVDWWDVAGRCKNAVAVACFLAGVGLFVLSIRDVTHARQVPAHPTPHGTYRMTIVDPSPVPHPATTTRNP